MNKLLFLLLLVIFLLCEVAITTMPLVLVLIIVFTSITRSFYPLILGVVAGAIIDAYAFIPLGLTSLFFVAICFLIFRYGLKLTTDKMVFVFFLTIVSSFIYLLVFGHPYVIWQVVVSSILSILLFSLFHALPQFNKEAL